MAMLAEKRVKNKYKSYSLKANPLSAESCKVGQRLLEKMGWTPGKGLGVNEDGCPDPLHIKFKCDIKGLGFRDSEKDALVCQEGFTNLLAKLSEHSDHSPEVSGICKKPNLETTPMNSLEVRSQKSRVRVHYHKFTRGKDLSRASTKDLASILGIKDECVSEYSAPEVRSSSLYPSSKHLEKIKPLNHSKNTDKSNGPDLLAINKDSRPEKFARKQNENCNINLKTEVPSTLSMQNLSNVDVGVDSDSVQSKRRKKKKKQEDLNSKHISENSNETPNVDCSVPLRRKSVTWGDVEVSYVSKYISDMADTSIESIQDDDSIALCDPEDTIQFYVNEKKKKKKSKSCKESAPNVTSEGEYLDTSCVVSNSSDSLQFDDSGKNTLKRKRKKSKCINETHSSSNVNSEDSVGYSFKDINSFKKEGAKNNLNASMKEHNNHSVEDEISGNLCTETVSTKKTKKKKRLKDVEVGDSLPQMSVVDDLSNLKIKDKRKSKSIKDHSGSNAKDMKLNGNLEVCGNHSLPKMIENAAIGKNEFQCQEKSLHSSKRKKRSKESSNSMCGETEANPVQLDSSIALSEDTVKDSVNSSNYERPVSSNPTLSALTNDRMDKWKKRSESERKKRKEETSFIDSDSQSNAVPLQNYTGRRARAALKALGEYQGKDEVAQVPPCIFEGSNLHSVIGYGCIISENKTEPNT